MKIEMLNGYVVDIKVKKTDQKRFNKKRNNIDVEPFEHLFRYGGRTLRKYQGHLF